MSIFSFFSRKAPSQEGAVPDSSGLGQADATQPVIPGDSQGEKSSTQGVGHAINRKSERHEQRELLYGVVRDAMTRAGVLAASYKFKVLSLDPRGRQYLIMMDLVQGSAGEVGRLAEIEALLAQTAKLRHDILVTAVYWRISEQVTVGQSTPLGQRPVPVQNHKPAPVQRRPAPALPGYEPLQQDEIAAFKRAIAGASPPAVQPAKGQVVTSGRRSQKPLDEFQDTQISPTAARPSPLSVTQYGDLN